MLGLYSDFVVVVVVFVVPIEIKEKNKLIVTMSAFGSVQRKKFLRT